MVTGFGGPGGGRARSYVIRVVRDQFHLISIKRLTRAAHRMHRRLSGRRNVRRICKAAGVDAVVYGRVLRRRGRWWLRLMIRDGASGRRVKRTVIRLRGPRMNASSRHDVRRFLKRYIPRVEGVEGGDEGTSGEETSSGGSQGIEETPTIPPVKPIHKKKKKGPSKSLLVDRAPYVTAVEGGLLLDAVARRFTMKPQDGNPDYKTKGIIAPIGFQFVVYPGAFVTKNLAGANFGIGFWWTRAFGIKSHRDGSGDGYKTVYQKIDFYLTYRWNILQKISSPELRLDLGLGNFRFMVDADMSAAGSDQIKAVGVKYWYVMPRLHLLYPVLPKRLSVLFSFGYMHPFQIGPTTEWWAFGDAKAWGIETMLGLDVRITWKFHMSFEGRYSYFGIKYTQAGQAGYDYTFVANSAADQYFGFVVGASIKY
ncbi:MAG: hypothetical protein J7M25_16160 [Deltaproteobacteria bacterium]|nr:hypothetical protein [Deltaproteobacteria bacterium]